MTDRLKATTVCFHYGDDGQRCRVKCLDPVLFCCATHLHEYQHTPAERLLQAAAKSIVRSTRFTEQGLPFLACIHLADWKRLCNAMWALTIHGYHGDAEVLTALVSSIESIRGPWTGIDSNVVRKGRPFERLVTRLYLEELAPMMGPASTRDPEGPSVRVMWNRRLPSVAGGKRQIDVVLRYQGADGVRDTIVECRDHEVEVSEMDAFATLIRRVQAERGVMVSSVGFQSGAERSAKFDNIEMRVVTEDDFTAEAVERVVDQMPQFEIIAEHVDARAERAVEFQWDKAGESRILVERRGVVIGTLAEFTAEAVEQHAPELGSLPPHIRFDTPDVRLLYPNGKAEEAKAIHLWVKPVETRRTCRLIMPRRPLAFLIKESDSPARRVSADAVPHFHTPSFDAGRFYVNLMGQAYYCERVDVDDDTAWLILLNDKQHGDKAICVELRAFLDSAGHYYRVEDPAALEVLHKDLEEFEGFRVRH
jgi:hypothetical protein